MPIYKLKELLLAVSVPLVHSGHEVLSFQFYEETHWHQRTRGTWQKLGLTLADD